MPICTWCLSTEGKCFPKKQFLVRRAEECLQVSLDTFYRDILPHAEKSGNAPAGVFLSSHSLKAYGYPERRFDMISEGDTVRVLVNGQFHGQVVRVLTVRRRKGSKTVYRLDTKWEDMPYPAWFDRNEIERVEVAK